MRRNEATLETIVEEEEEQQKLLPNLKKQSLPFCCSSLENIPESVLESVKMHFSMQMQISAENLLEEKIKPFFGAS